MLDLLLRHYRGAFDRIFLYSPSATLDKGWGPLRRYIEEVQHVSKNEQTFFDEFDETAMQEQIALQMRVAEYAKTAKIEVPQILFIVDDFADDERLHRGHTSLASIATRGRHFGASLWVSTQKFRTLAPVIRTNLNGLFVWPPSNRLERKAIIEEISGRYGPEEIEEMLQHVSQRPYGFLFCDLKTSDENRMFQDSLVQYLRPSQ